MDWERCINKRDQYVEGDRSDWKCSNWQPIYLKKSFFRPITILNITQFSCRSQSLQACEEVMKSDGDIICNCFSSGLLSVILLENQVKMVSDNIMENYFAHFF